MARYRPVDPGQSFPELEQRVLERWKETDVFHRSLAQREGCERYVFYEGPPTANGPPGAHHVLSRVFKDIFPRYKTMCGYYAPRKGGWDCHGLPVELQIEKELGIKSKADIEAYGIAEFNARCRESVFAYLEEWNRLTERIGFWIDLDDAYRTLDNAYIESVWWSLAEIHKRGLLTEDDKVVPYCPRCGTALSSHEVALGYRDVVDPSIYVRFAVKGRDESLLVWTTTPWTLPSNAAVAVNPAVDYVRARVDGETLVLAEALVGRVLGEDAEILERFPGSELVGTAYEPPFDYFAGLGGGAHRVYAAAFVTTEDGTGLVHTATGFGEDDLQLARDHGLPVVNPVRPDGTFDERVPDYEGMFVKDADPKIVADLDRRGILFREEGYEHAYPHCWRCDTPLLYYSKTSWYIRTTARRDELLAANEAIDWHPGHIKHGRFGKWLEQNVDWALSRERYWGTPLPIWRSEDGDRELAVGSLEQLRELATEPVPDDLDLHRPAIDEIVLRDPETGAELRRVPEVIDVWYDSGAMPFAQWHYPFENREQFERAFPADYICEALDQTRGWFYSLLAVSTLMFGRSSYETCLCLGLILDPEGRKMSKTRGNVVEPWEVIDRHGADAFRWYYFASQAPWSGYRFSVDTVGEAVRKFLLTLWNTYGFFVLYANVDGFDAERAESLPAAERPDLDRWALSRLQAVIAQVRERMDAYDTTGAGRAIAEFVDDLSNWYVRRSRRRFWRSADDADKRSAYLTLHECLVTVARLLAPFTPFVADEIHSNLVREPDSVHLCDYPEPDPARADPELDAAMERVRETVELGRAARAQAKVKVRQPLREAVVVVAERERAALERLEGLVLDELNVKEISYVSDAGELARHEVKPNYRQLGPRFGKHMPQVAAAVASLDPAHVAQTLERGGRVGITIDGAEHGLTAEDLTLAMLPREGYQVERVETGGASHAVALRLELDDDLRREGLAREVVHAVQSARRSAGLEIEDRIALRLAGGAPLLEAVEAFRDYVAGETLAARLELGPDGAAPEGHRETASIEGAELEIALAKA